LAVVVSSPSGPPAREGVGPGTTVRISTGAAVPEGATAVVPIERARPVDGTDGRIWVEASTDGDNIRRAGEDVRAGDVVLHRGAVLGPAELGVAAAIGRASLPCARVPRVAVLVTGDELTDPGEDLGPGGIYSSNSFALAALAKRSGARLSGQVTVGDSADSTRDSIRSALEDADVICVSGGMSVGPHDYVKPALADLGVTEHFWGVALRPGKPTWFGSLDRRLVFGLPGNPVSAMVAFYLFVRPALAVLQGAPAGLSRVSAVLDDPVRLLAAREQAVRVRLFARDDGWHAAITGPQGSHMLTSMLGAGGLAMVGPGEGEAPPGTRVEVELL
jgi:molybdopterin molybdotransferase